KRWVDDLLPLLVDGDQLGVDSFATHHLPLEEGPKAYETFREKADGMIKTLLIP
ncbi:glutathione-dependent formaldehyde dehydrogenase, partial [Streptomyces rubiginosohelvolus]